MPTKRYKHYIGIDPGTHTGIAVWNVEEQKLEDYFTSVFWGCIDYLKGAVVVLEGLRVLVEDPNQIKPTFNRWQSRRVNETISQRVGMNKRDAQLILEFCERNLIDAAGVKPETTKWTAQMLKEITGIDKRTSQHTRDAIKLVWGLRG